MVLLGDLQMANLAATRALMELGVFEAIPTAGKSITADELAAKTGGEKELIGEPHLSTPTIIDSLATLSDSKRRLTELAGWKVNLVSIVRLMRNATVLGPFAEVGPQTYAHTPYSEIYLVPQMRGVLKLM